MTTFWLFFSSASALFIYGAWVDYKTYRIPYATWLGIPFVSLIYYGIHPGNTHPMLWPISLIAGLFVLSQAIQYLKKTPALGHGDLTLLFSSLLWLNIDQYPIFFILTGAIGTLMALGQGRQKFFPLVPAIAIGWFLSVLWQNLFLN